MNNQYLCAIKKGVPRTKEEADRNIDEIINRIIRGWTNWVIMSRENYKKSKKRIRKK